MTLSRRTDIIAEVFEDAADDTVTSRVEFDTDAFLTVVVLVVGDGIGGDHAVVEFDAVSDAEHIVLRQRSVEGHVIEFGNLAARMGQAFGKFPVIGKQKETCGVFVEAAHGEDALIGRRL
jgi:hypothetical protein